MDSQAQFRSQSDSLENHDLIGASFYYEELEVVEAQILLFEVVDQNGNTQFIKNFRVRPVLPLPVIRVAVNQGKESDSEFFQEIQDSLRSMLREIGQFSLDFTRVVEEIDEVTHVHLSVKALPRLMAQLDAKLVSIHFDSLLHQHGVGVIALTGVPLETGGPLKGRDHPLEFFVGLNPLSLRKKYGRSYLFFGFSVPL